MLVSMTPNEEVKTIHASLNDGKLRKWEFEPYTENGKIELTDQDYATIRSIKGNTIKFNQLVQNGNFAENSGWQTSGGGGTLTIANNKASVVAENATTVSLRPTDTFNIISGRKYFLKYDITSTVATTNTRARLYRANEISVYGKSISLNANIKTKYSDIIEPSTSSETAILYMYVNQNNAYTGTFVIENVILIDLTAMGIDNLTTVQEVENWLSNNIGLLPYYDYTPGTLIPFKGSGIKTTGKNLLSGIENGTIIGTGEKNTSTIRCRTESIFSLKAGTYTISIQTSVSGKTPQISYQYWATDKQGGTNTRLYDSGWVNVPITITLTNDTFFSFVIHYTDNSAITYTELSAQLEFGSSATDYEPYTSSTLSLPISTYFPTGMKDVPDYANGGTVYDEWTSSRADMRIGEQDLGSLTWTYITETKLFFATMSERYKAVPLNTKPNFLCSKYEIGYPTYIDTDFLANKHISSFADTSQNRIVLIHDEDYSDATVFKQMLSDQNVKLYFELATPTSQDISLDLTYPVYKDGTEQILPVNGSTPTTSPMVATIEYPDRTEEVNFLYKQTTFESAIPQFSLVCKNQELPMSLEDGKLICECDSSITNESGFFDAKVKMQDLDSVAYSQKIQLHVERGIND